MQARFQLTGAVARRRQRHGAAFRANARVAENLVAGRLRKLSILAKKNRNGLTALFCGPSGTGKTMATTLASSLGKGLYRVDLSAVTDKYIGETEKNLSRAFAAAQKSNAVLYFDEADALFGKRTGIRDSHDRYANQEVSYLLARLERYRGIVILSTNNRSAIDPATMRRFDAVVELPPSGNDLISS